METPLAGEAQGRSRSCRLTGTPYHGSLGLPEQGPGGREGNLPRPTLFHSSSSDLGGCLGRGGQL